MDTEIRESFALVWKFLFNIHPAHKTKGFTEESCLSYQRILQDIPGEILMAAAVDQAAKKEWFPSAAELREAAFDIMHAKHERLTDGEAWGLFMQTCKSEGWRPRAVFEALQEKHPLLALAAQQIGIRAIAQSNVDVEGVHRAHFLKIYTAIVARTDIGMRMVPEVKAVADRLQLVGGAQSVGDVVARLVAGGKQQ
jgi:hypothetical protein